MKPHISLFKILFFIILSISSSVANAEFYFENDLPISTLVVINCRGHHCHWKEHLARKPHYVKKHHRNKDDCCIDTCCNQDLATGDDNPCRHPELQINY